MLLSLFDICANICARENLQVSLPEEIEEELSKKRRCLSYIARPICLVPQERWRPQINTHLKYIASPNLAEMSVVLLFLMHIYTLTRTCRLHIKYYREIKMVEDRNKEVSKVNEFIKNVKKIEQFLIREGEFVYIPHAEKLLKLFTFYLELQGEQSPER